MTDYLVLIGVMAAIPAQSVAMKFYQKRGFGRRNLLYTSFIGLFAMAVFLVCAAVAGKFSFSTAYLPYSLGFAVTYGMAIVFQILALSCGPMPLTTLVLSYSLLLVTFYGIFFLNETPGWGFIPGVALLAVCLFLTNYQKRPKKDAAAAGETPPPRAGGITLRWVIFVWLAFLGNGLCTIVQKMATVRFGTRYSNEFMVAALLAITVGFGIAGLIRERDLLVPFAKRGWFFAAACGALNGLANVAVIFLSTRMPASVQFPFISAGSILFSLLFSVVLFKEKLTRMQLIGLGVGVLSVVFLNLA